MSYLLAIAALAVLIIVHEAGHMWVARWTGMRVDKFSVFFGPPLLRWRGRKTVYQLATVPLGGYVQIAGMNPHEPVAEDDPGSYQNKAAWKRFATVAAGPAINYLFAIVLVLFVMLAWGAPRYQMQIAEVSDGLPAQQAGMKAGDVIVAIDGEPVRSIGQVLTAISQSEGKPLRVTVRRAGREKQLSVAPRRVEKGYRVGIHFGREVAFSEIGVGDALALGFAYPFRESAKVLDGLVKLARRETTAEVGGPLEIVRQLKMSFEARTVNAILFLAMLNVYLGLFNLLPLPALDGGRLAFLAIEMVGRRPIDRRVENIVHTVGFLLLFAVLLLVTFNDIQRLL